MGNFRDLTAWKLAKRIAVDPARRAAVRVIGRDRIPLMWCAGCNWGDALSPVLVSLLSGKRAMHLEGLHHRRYLAIGSILGSANERAEVWGSGFIRADDRVVGPPRAVHAVRGPLSREALRKQGVDCPEIYGDPALLLPRFFDPPVERRHAVGIIPHYVDKNHPWVRQHAHDPDVLVIDVESGTREFVRAVKSCEVILSSSLHGLICADAYRVPRAWITLSNDVVGGDFKFRDYHLSIGAGEPTRVRVSDATPLAQAVGPAKQHPLAIDLRKLMLACPFLCASLREEVERSSGEDAGLPSAFVTRRLAE